MTVIATDGQTMAGDGLASLHDRIISLSAVKVRRLSNGALFGAAGETCDAAKLFEWIDGGKDVSCVPDLTSIDALVLNADGSIDLYEEQNKGACERVAAPIAIGSGMEGAMGAMDAGASPERAVEIAIGRTPTCGGRVTVLSI